MVRVHVEGRPLIDVQWRHLAAAADHTYSMCKTGARQYIRWLRAVYISLAMPPAGDRACMADHAHAYHACACACIPMPHAGRRHAYIRDIYEARIYTRDIYHARTRLHLQAEDRVEVGVAVGGLIDDLAPVESLLVRALGLPLEQPW